MNRYKEAQCSVQAENTDSKVHDNFKLVQTAAFMIQVLLLRFSLKRFLKEKEKDISFKMFLNHVEKQQQ